MKFYELVMQGLLRHVNFEVVKVILIASPGFVRDQFFEYIFQEAVKNDIKMLFENKNKFLLVHSSSGFKHSLKGNLFLFVFYMFIKRTFSKSEKSIQLFQNNSVLLRSLY